MSSLESDRGVQAPRFTIKPEEKRQTSNEGRFDIQAPDQAGPARPVEMRQRALQEFDSEKDDAPSAAGIDQETQYIENAILLIQNGEADLARNLLIEVLRSNEGSSLALRWLGQSYVATGEYEEAEECFRSLVEQDRRPEYLIDLADALYAQNEDEQALQFYQESTESSLQDSELLFNVYKNLGNIFVRAGDFSSAEENYNRAYTLNPDSDVLLVNYGTLEIQRQELGTAVQRFRQAVDINPKNDRAWLGLALVHRDFGDHELAWANLEEALWINACNEVALNLCVDWGLKDHKDDLVIRYLERYLEQDNENSQKKLLLAQILFMDHRFWQSQAVLNQILEQHPEHEDAEKLLKQIQDELSSREGTAVD